jgi:hypothetical protein
MLRILRQHLQDPDYTDPKVPSNIANIYNKSCYFRPQCLQIQGVERVEENQVLLTLASFAHISLPFTHWKVTVKQTNMAGEVATYSSMVSLDKMDKYLITIQLGDKSLPQNNAFREKILSNPVRRLFEDERIGANALLDLNIVPTFDAMFSIHERQLVHAHQNITATPCDDMGAQYDVSIRFTNDDPFTVDVLRWHNNRVLILTDREIKSPSEGRLQLEISTDLYLIGQNADISNKYVRDAIVLGQFYKPFGADQHTTNARAAYWMQKRGHLPNTMKNM